MIEPVIESAKWAEIWVSGTDYGPAEAEFGLGRGLWTPPAS